MSWTIDLKGSASDELVAQMGTEGQRRCKSPSVLEISLAARWKMNWPSLLTAHDVRQASGQAGSGRIEPLGTRQAARRRRRMGGRREGGLAACRSGPSGIRRLRVVRRPCEIMPVEAARAAENGHFRAPVQHANTDRQGSNFKAPCVRLPCGFARYGGSLVLLNGAPCAGAVVLPAHWTGASAHTIGLGRRPGLRVGLVFRHRRPRRQVVQRYRLSPGRPRRPRTGITPGVCRARRRGRSRKACA